MPESCPVDAWPRGSPRCREGGHRGEGARARRWRHRRDHRLLPRAGGARGDRPRAPLDRGRRDLLCQRRAPGAGSCVRVGVAEGAEDPPQVALHEGPGPAAQAAGGPAHVALGSAVPRPVHRRAGEAQHAPQGTAVSVLRRAAQRGCGRHRCRLRRAGQGQPLPLPVGAESREGHRAHRNPARARDGDAGARPRRHRRGRAGPGPGQGPDRRRDARAGRPERGRPDVLAQPRRLVRRAPGRPVRVRHPRARNRRRRRPHRAGGDGSGRSRRRRVRARGRARGSVPGLAHRGEASRSGPARATRSRCRWDART